MDLGADNRVAFKTHEMHSLLLRKLIRIEEWLSLSLKPWSTPSTLHLRRHFSPFMV